MPGQANESAVALPAQLQNSVEQFERWCRGFTEKLDETSKINSTLYHYTSAANLRNILDTQQIWFTDYRHLNDSSELRYGITIVRDALLNYEFNQDPRVKFILKLLNDLLSMDVLSKLGVFVASFSKERNDLGQWRAYGDNGRGFAIGFAPSMFADTPIKTSPDENAFIYSITYGNRLGIEKTQTTTDKLISSFVSEMDSFTISDQNIGTVVEFARQLLVIASSHVFIVNALTAKHPAYENEREVRLIIMNAIETLQNFTRVRTRGFEFVPYIPHPWPIKTPDAISEIIVGPAAPLDTERVLNTLLASYGLHGVKIERSDIPYRAP